MEDSEHIVFTEPPASPTPSGDVSMDVTPSTSNNQQLHASVHRTSDAEVIMHPEPSEPAQGEPIPVHISQDVPQPMAGVSIGENKEEGQCSTDGEEDVPSLADISDDERAKDKDPWNDTAFDLQAKFKGLRWDYIEPEPDYEEYGVR